MNRRRLLRLSGAGLALASGGFAGCLGSDDGDGPPPREAEVFADVSIERTSLALAIEPDPTVESRVDNVDASAIVGALAPIGTASAGSRSSGSTARSSGARGRGDGGYSSAPKGRHGWAVYGATSGRHWRDDHEDELETYSARIATLGLAYMGSNDDYRDDAPGPEPVPWDEEWSNPEPGSTVEADLAALSSGDADEGWYRVGTHLVSPDGDIDFDWQAADVRIERESAGLAVEEAWHVRPPV